MRQVVRLPGLGVGPFSAVHFFAALVVMIFITPFVDRPPYGEAVTGVVMTVVMLMGLLAVGGRKRTLLVAVLLLVPAMAAKWVDHFWNDLVPDAVPPALSIIFLSMLIGTLMLFVLRAKVVDREVVCAALSAYISMGLLWMFAYVLVSQLHPNSFAVFGQPLAQIDSFQAFYFSFITLISIGYGDITPLSRVTQMLAVLEGMMGMFFMVTLISRLVAVYSSPPKS